jgi:hypothetical protein
MASTNIQRTLGQNSNSGKLTISVWVKRAGFGEQGICGSWYSGAYHGILYFNSNDQITFYDYRNSYIMRKITTAQFRDVGAWYHIVCNFDHTLGSPTGKIYVNGVEQTLSTNANYTQGAQSSWLTDYTFNIGTYDGSGNYFNGNMSDFYFIQGYVYEASTFGETDATTGIWKPITEPTVNYSSTGNNSCHLKFENLANMDLDSGDNNVSFTTTGNLTQTVDTPSNVFATLNALDTYYANGTLSNGNLKYTGSAVNYDFIPSTIQASSGKYYAEVKIEATPSNNAIVGITGKSMTDTQNYLGKNNYEYGYIGSGSKVNNASFTSYGDSFTAGDIIGIAMDLDNNYLYFSKNGTFQNSGDPTSGATGTGAISITDPASTTNGFYAFAVCSFDSGGADILSINFGNGYFGTTPVASAGSNGNGAIFEYDVPTGYYALNTKNINTYG